MTTISIDSVVRSVLLKTGKNLHFYIEYLSYGLSGVKFLNLTTLGQINTTRLTVDTDSMTVEIPCDYVDWVRVGYESGERIRPLILDETLNRLNNTEDDGTIIPYEVPEATDGLSDFTTDLDSDMDFGVRTDRGDYRFKILKERDEIQLSADFPLEEIYLEYLSDGQHVDACTAIDTRAGETLEKYILWQAAVHSRSKNDSERREAERRFTDQWRYLRAMTNDLTPEEVVHAKYSGYSPLKW